MMELERFITAAEEDYMFKRASCILRATLCLERVGPLVFLEQPFVWRECMLKAEDVWRECMLKGEDF